MPQSLDTSLTVNGLDTTASMTVTILPGHPDSDARLHAGRSAACPLICYFHGGG